MLSTPLQTNWRARSTVLLGACGLAAALHHYPTPVAGRLLLWGAAVFAAAHLLAAIGRVVLGHWGVESLRPLLSLELLLGIGLPLGIVISLRLSGPSVALEAVIGLLLFVLHGLYVKLQQDLSWRVRFAGLSTISDRVAARRIDAIAGDRTRIGEADPGQEPDGLMRLLNLLTARRKWGLTGMRLVFLWMIMTGLWLTADATATQVIHGWVHPESVTEGGKGGGKGGGNATATEASEGAAGGQVTAGSAGGRTGGSRESPGQAACVDQIQSTAPDWAQADLGELYYGGLGDRVTKAPGFRIGGCPGRAHVPAALEGKFVWALGLDPAGEIRSLVVDSLEFGPEIFIAPAAQRVLAMIGSGLEPLGGQPRFPVAGGDVVTVTGRRGTVALVRSEEHLPGEPRVAAPYVELPPTVATAWLGAMGEQKGWLWPSAPLRAGDDEVFGLAARSGGRPLYEVVYDPATGTARRDQYEYSLPETPLGYDELRAWAATVPGD